VLRATLLPRGVDQDASHGLGGRGEEVPAAVPGLSRLGIDESKVRLVNEGGGLEGLSWGLAGQLGSGQTAELSIDHGEQFFRGAGFAARNCFDYLRDWPGQGMISP
jgi:hypothetical protein